MKRTITGWVCAAASAMVLFAPACSSSNDTPATDGGTGGGDGGVSEGGDGGGGKGTFEACKPDESAPVPQTRCTTDKTNTSLPQCGVWTKVELPGLLCGDGSQFKFFVNYSNTSNNLAVEFEPGGACWDYESCTGEGGVRGAANPHGITDDHMGTYELLNLLRRNTDDNPVQNYNMVFVSYCTGDIHTGNNAATYTSATDASKQIVFHHDGHKNSLAVADWMQKTFTTVPKLLVTGCSAGGAGAILNYHSIRQTMGSNVQCSYMLDDSGPIFHKDGPSAQLLAKIRTAWNTDTVLDSYEGQLPISSADLKNDPGLVSEAIARKYPHDRLSLVAYRMDLNYSLYSYQRFFPGSTEADIHAKWWQDLSELIKTYDAQPNLAYYLPFFRSDNCSHCVSIPPIGNPPLEPLDAAKALGQPWSGTEIPELQIDLKQFTTTLLDDTKPLKSYVQDVKTNESFTPGVSAQCMEGG